MCVRGHRLSNSVCTCHVDVCMGTQLQLVCAHAMYMCAGGHMLCRSVSLWRRIAPLISFWTVLGSFGGYRVVPEKTPPTEPSKAQVHGFQQCAFESTSWSIIARISWPTWPPMCWFNKRFRSKLKTFEFADSDWSRAVLPLHPRGQVV